jgi:hypothetical protein
VLSAEPCLLQAVQEAVKTALGLTDDQCTIESDEDFVPQTAGDLHVSIVPASISLGNVHQSSGTTRDVEYGCRVSVFVRSRAVPRDKRRTLYLDQLSGVNALLDKVVYSVDWKASITARANQILAAITPTAGPFVGYLRLIAIDSRVRGVAVDTYGASSQASASGSEVMAGVTRGITLGRIRRLEAV